MPVVTLRPLSVDDAAAMTTVLADPSLYEFTGGEPPTDEGLTRLYGIQTRGGTADGSERWINSIVELAGEPIGYVQATVPLTSDEPTDIAWVIGRPWQGRGFASAAVQLLVEELAEAGVRQLVAHIHPDHVASQRIAQKAGLRPTEIVVDGETRWVGEIGSD